MKKIILLSIMLLAIAACASLQAIKELSTKEINVCSLLDKTDCVTFIIPADFPDFINEFRDTGMCFAIYPSMISCFWYDGEEAEDGTIPTAVWYTLYFWSDGYTMASSRAFCLEAESHVEFIEEWSKYFTYSEDGVPEQVSYYEYRMQFFDLEGIPRISEEEFNAMRKQEIEERNKAMEEFQRMRKGEIPT